MEKVAMKKEELGGFKNDLHIIHEAFKRYKKICEATAEENERLKREIEVLKKSAEVKK
jgi:archaellum component FlaC